MKRKYKISEEKKVIEFKLPSNFNIFFSFHSKIEMNFLNAQQETIFRILENEKFIKNNSFFNHLDYELLFSS